MPLDTAVTGRAARILIERDPGPGDRLDAFLVLAGQEYLWRRRDRPGADFGEAVRMYEAAAGRRLPRPTSLPFFGAVKRRRIERRREVAVWLAGRFLGWLYSPDGRGRASDTDWRPDGSLSISLGLPYEQALKEPPRSLPHAEHRVIELALANVVDPGVEGVAREPRR